MKSISTADDYETCFQKLIQICLYIFLTMKALFGKVSLFCIYQQLYREMFRKVSKTRIVNERQMVINCN